MNRYVKTHQGAFMPTTISMPPKKDRDDELPPKGASKEILKRYRLQVDRLTKDSFADKAEAEKRGRDIKKVYPVVQVAIYDAETEERTVI